MAVLILSANEAWFSSASLLKYVAEQLESSGLFPTYQQPLSNVAVGWQALDISDMGPLDLAAVRSITQDIISEIIADGPDQRGGEQSYKAIVDRLTELQEKLLIAINARPQTR